MGRKIKKSISERNSGVKKIIALCAFVFFVLWRQMTVAEEATMYARPDEEFLDSELKTKYFDIQKEAIRFVDKHTSRTTGLVESFNSASLYYWIPEQKVFELGKESYLLAQAFTYDQATAAMMYVACGLIEKARGILDALEKDFYLEKNGYIGLLTSYRSDEFTPDRTLVIGCDGDRIHVGPNMWVALACMQYVRITGDGRYLSLVVDMAKWVSMLPHFIFSDGAKGGPSMGSGWGPDWSKVYSTENCIDYYSILNILLRVYDQGSDKVKALFQQAAFSREKIQQELAAVECWLKEVAYNKETGGFNIGFNQDGVDTAKGIDTVSNSLSVIGPQRLKQWGIDPFRLITFAEKYLLVKDEIKGQTISGFDFTVPAEMENHRRRLIWVEGTAQMVLAYKIMSKYCTSLGNKERALAYKEKAIFFAKELDKIAELADMPNKALPYTSYTPGDQEFMVTFKDEWEIPRGTDGKWVSSVASTAWRFFSLTYYNPMMMGRLAFSF